MACHYVKDAKKYQYSMRIGPNALEMFRKFGLTEHSINFLHSQIRPFSPKMSGTAKRQGVDPPCEPPGKHLAAMPVDRKQSDEHSKARLAGSSGHVPSPVPFRTSAGILKDMEAACPQKARSSILCPSVVTIAQQKAAHPYSPSGREKGLAASCPTEKAVWPAQTACAVPSSLVQHVPGGSCRLQKLIED